MKNFLSNFISRTDKPSGDKVRIPSKQERRAMKKLWKENRRTRMEKTTLDCGGQLFEITTSPGQIINPRKMCKKLLKDKFNQNNEQEKNKFVSKGYKGQ